MWRRDSGCLKKTPKIKSRASIRRVDKKYASQAPLVREKIRAATEMPQAIEYTIFGSTLCAIVDAPNSKGAAVAK
jgi:hypothetical protein